MKVIITVLFLVLFKPHISLAQADSLLPPESTVIYITKLLDSLPFFLQTGKAYLGEKPECTFPEHIDYLIVHRQFNFSKRALELSGSRKQAYIQMYACNLVANEFERKRDYINSKKWGLKVLDIADKNNFDFEELHHCRIGLNNICFFTGDYEGAMNISSEGLTKAEKINDRERMAHFNNVLGYIMMKLKNFDQSKNYFSTYLQLAQQLKGKLHELKDKLYEAHAWLNLADLSVAEAKFPDAIPLIKNALNIYQTYAGENMGRYDKEAYCFNKLSEIYKLMHEDSVAIQYCLKAIGLVVNPNFYDLAAYYINAGDIYNKMGKPDNAIIYLRRGLKIADSIKHGENIRDAYEQLSLSFSIKKMFDSAFVYQQSFYRLRDSILDETSQREIVQRNAELQIERQRRIQQAVLARQQIWRNIIIGSLIFAFVIVIMLYNRRRIKQKMIYQQRFNEQQNEMFNIAATAQDKERKRIAEDIHDGLGSVLSAAKLKLSSLEEDGKLLTEEQKGKYQATLSLLDDAATELRNISHNIMPATLSKLGLIAALKNVIGNISSRTGLRVQFEENGFDSRSEEATEISIYRIVLELLNNVIKHAGATKAIVQLIKYPDYINITVEDNGRGFEYQKTVEENKGIGLSSIVSRVNYLKGTMHIDAVPGRGTTIIIDIPMTAAKVKYQNIGIAIK
jgi:two-component system, NarL family, sensor kinase